MPQVNVPPLEMAASNNPPVTAVGIDLDAVDPSPSCPVRFSPQQYGTPAVVTAHECPPPARTVSKVRTSETRIA